MPLVTITGTSFTPRVRRLDASQVYTADGAVARHTFIDLPDADGAVATATSGPGYGIALNDAADGELVTVALAGDLDVIAGGAITAGAFLVATTAGKAAAAAAGVATIARSYAQVGDGTAYAADDYVPVLLGVGAPVDA